MRISASHLLKWSMLMARGSSPSLAEVLALASSPELNITTISFCSIFLSVVSVYSSTTCRSSAATLLAEKNSYSLPCSIGWAISACCE